MKFAWGGEIVSPHRAGGQRAGGRLRRDPPRLGRAPRGEDGLPVRVCRTVASLAVSRPFRILVVEDNHLILRLLHLILEGAGYLAVTVDSGGLALEIVNDAAPDLCIVDEMMPGIRGSELIRALRGSRDPRVARVPVIGISGRESGGRDLLAAGATAFVPKPIDERSILAAVRGALGAEEPAEAGAPG